MSTDKNLLVSSLFLKFRKLIPSFNNNLNNLPALKDIFKDDFYIGVALSLDQIEGREPGSITLVEKHFNSITAENIMKWEEIHPEPDRYNFEPVDRFVEFGERNRMFMIGHTLVWFHQTPDWVFLDESGKQLSREALLERMKDHIFTVMGRYKGRVHGWDVVNEAVLEDGQYRKSKWFGILGEDHICKAFEYAHQADPDAELYYNDYNMWKKGQYEGVIRVVKMLQSKNIRIDGVGIQGHWGLDYPGADEIENFIQEFSKLNVKLMITEMDISVLPYFGDYGKITDISELDTESRKKYNPYSGGLPDDVQKKLADRYAEIFSILLRHRDKFSRVTFWAVNDKQSWRNYMPLKGLTDYPMLFDRNNKPKPAFHAIVNAAEQRNLNITENVSP